MKLMAAYGGSGLPRMHRRHRRSLRIAMDDPAGRVAENPQRASESDERY
ncbi:MAG: hypothetical protein ACRC6V_02145 [Bacteroidales bacterium]